MTSSVTGPSGSMSPDALLAYCQMQLDDLDDQTASQMNLQEMQLQERTAVENVQTTLETFGTTGPTTGPQMDQCIAAFQTAIASLPTGDPMAAQLTSQMDQMTSKYGYQAAYTSLPATQSVAYSGAAAQLHPDAGTASGAAPPSTTGGASAQPTYHPSVLTSPPTNDDWAGTTGALGNLADGIKSQSEIDMLTLQDLVSQRQQAVELATGMMTKEDETLEDGAKAIGQ
jgi:hypothetical protein